MVDLNPEGCCCADETLGADAEAALVFVSQGFSGVDVAIYINLLVGRSHTLSRLGGVRAGPSPSSQTGYFGTKFRITVPGVSCERWRLKQRW